MTVSVRAVGESAGESASGAKRFAYLDNLRSFVIFLVVAVHASVTYSGYGGWYYKEASPDRLDMASRAVFGLFEAFTQAWFMGVLFFLAAFFATKSLAKRDSGERPHQRGTQLAELRLRLLGSLRRHRIFPGPHRLFPTAFRPRDSLCRPPLPELLRDLYVPCPGPDLDIPSLKGMAAPLPPQGPHRGSLAFSATLALSFLVLRRIPGLKAVLR